MLPTALFSSHAPTLAASSETRSDKSKPKRCAMIQTLEAVFVGEGVPPHEPMALKPNARVRIVVETLIEADVEPVSFLRAARSLKLKGPVDWSTNLDT